MKHFSISIAHRVKEIIEGFESDQLFSTQDLLRLINFGNRNAIDIALSRLVKSKIIKRLSYGVFAKKEAAPEKITPFKVATVKAKAFGKTIQLFGEDAAHKVGLYNGSLKFRYTQSNGSEFELENSPVELKSTYTFYTSGSSSSFKFGKSTIKLVSASQRKREIPDDLTGMVLKAAWFSGRSNIAITKSKARHIIFNQKKDKILLFRKYIRTVPNWLAKSLHRALA